MMARLVSILSITEHLAAPKGSIFQFSSVILPQLDYIGLLKIILGSSFDPIALLVVSTPSSVVD